MKIGSLLRQIALLAHRSPWWALALALLLTFLSMFAVVRIRFNTDLTDLLPEKAPIVKALNHVVKESGGLGYQMVTATSPDPQANRRFLADLKKRLQSLPEIDFVIQRIPIEYIADRRLLFLHQKDLQTLKERIQKKIRYENRKKNPLVMDLDDEKDPGLDIKDIEKKYATRVKDFRPYYEAEEGRYQGILIRPKGFGNRVDFNEHFNASLMRAIQETKPTSYHPKLMVDTHGTFTDALREVEGIQRDILQAAWSTLLLLFLLLFGYFRRLKALFLIMLPLVFAILWTLALTYLTLRYLNMITGFVGVILLGLGVDYGIHLLARYLHERSHGASVTEAIEACASQTGVAIWVGCITTVAAFFSLLISDFKGFSQFGIIAGFGLLLCLFSMIAILPAMLTLLERFGLIVPPKNSAQLALEASHFGAFPFTKPLVLGSTAFFFAMLLATAWLRFEYNQNKIGYFPDGYEREAKREARLRTLFPPGMENLAPIAFLAQDEAEIRKLTHLIEERAKKHQASDVISEIVSVFTFIPPQQKERLAILGEIRELLKKNDVESFLEGDLLKQFRKLKPMLDVQAFAPTDLPREIRQDLITPNGRFLLLVTSQRDMRDGHYAIKLKRILDGLRIGDKEYAPAGAPIVYALLLTTVVRDGLLALFLALLIVGGFLWFEFKSPRLWLLGMLPLLFGIIWMLGIAALLGFKISFINMVALPILIGIGIDNSIHLLHRQRELPHLGVRGVWFTMAPPIAMATITSVIGFAGMIFGNHKGLQGLGILASIGLITLLLASLVILPAFMQSFSNKKPQA